MNLGRKKGQITLFAVIGVILLIVFGLLIYYYSSTESIGRGRLLVDDVSEEYSPIQNYVHSCIEQIAERCIKKLGERGGFLYDEDYLSPGFYNLVPSEEEPTEANSFYFFPTQKNLVIPYWFHMYRPNEDQVAGFKTERPLLISKFDDGFERLKNKDNSVESQIDNYINLRLNDCLDNFESFRQGGVIVNPENMPTTTTYILDDNVQIQLNYPLQINSTISEDSLKMQNFGVVIPVRLKKVYELAEFITEVQIEQNFLEKNLINLIILNSMVGSELLAPMNDFTFAFGSRGNTWELVELEKNMQYLLMFTKLLQVQGSKNYERIYVDPFDNTYETRQRVYDNMIIPVLDYYEEDLDISLLNDVDIRLNYLDWWPYYFNVNDKGGEVKPDVIGVEFGPLAFGMQRYRTLYDVSWPVLVTMNDEESFNGRGFTFNFGLEGNLRQNKPMNSSAYANRLIGQYDRPPSVCDINQRTEDVKVRVLDRDLNNLSGVSIILRTGLETCALGRTNESGMLETKVPSGMMTGILVASKEGYLDETVQFVQGAEEYDFRGMQEIKLMNFKVLKQKVVREGDGFKVIDTIPLEKGDKAIVSLMRHDVYGDKGSFQSSFTMDESNLEFESPFTAGSYDVKVTLMNMDQQVVVEDTEVKGLPVSGGVFHGMITGGVELSYQENNDFSVFFSHQDIVSSSEIVLYILEFNVDWSNRDNFDLLGKVRQYSILYVEDLIPELR